MFLITICCLREVGLMSLTNEFDKKKTACLLGLCIRLSCSGRWHVAIDILIILKKGGRSCSDYIVNIKFVSAEDHISESNDSLH